MLQQLKQKISCLVYDMIPKVHNLPEVIYIRWLDREFFIRKI